MNRTIRTILLATAFVQFAASADAQQRNAAPGRTANLDAMVAQQRAFSKMSIESSAQAAFDRYMSHDALLFRPRAVRAVEFRVKNPLPKSLALAWEPEYADMSRAGDLGYTTGPWVAGSRTTDSDPRFGQYLTIWRRQPDGKYLAVFDASVMTPASVQSPRKLQTAPAPAYTKAGDYENDRASLLRADNNFANIARQRGYSAALSPLALPDVRLLRNTVFESVKMDSVATTMKGMRVTWWAPVEAVASSSGDFGYTRGTYTVVPQNGRPEAGDYVRIWRRDANGTWRVALDLLSAGR